MLGVGGDSCPSHFDGSKETFLRFTIALNACVALINFLFSGVDGLGTGSSLGMGIPAVAIHVATSYLIPTLFNLKEC